MQGIRLDRREALRYLGAAEAEAVLPAVEDVARRLEDALAPRFVYKDYALDWKDGAAYLPDANLSLPGALAKRVLQDCDAAVLLLCTLGARFDALLRAWQARDMASAVILDACGSAYVEAGCAAAEAEISARHPHLFLTDRFSPGYGDLPLEIQGDLVAAVNGEKYLGVCVTPSLLMAPAKTVSAVVGLARRPQAAVIRGCDHCALRHTCAYRKRGMTCAV